MNIENVQFFCVGLRTGGGRRKNRYRQDADWLQSSVRVQAMDFPIKPRRTTISPHPNSYQGVGDLLVSRRKPSILVVDDYPQNAELLRELLAGRGYRIVTVLHAADAEIE